MQRSDVETTKPPAYLFRYPSMSKSKDTKHTNHANPSAQPAASHPVMSRAETQTKTKTKTTASQPADPVSLSVKRYLVPPNKTRKSLPAEISQISDERNKRPKTWPRIATSAKRAALGRKKNSYHPVACADRRNLPSHQNSRSPRSRSTARR